MNPIATLTETLMADRLQGANGTDPVRKPRARKRRFTRRGTS
jgi:hypothetical protein